MRTFTLAILLALCVILPSARADTTTDTTITTTKNSTATGATVTAVTDTATSKTDMTTKETTVPTNTTVTTETTTTGTTTTTTVPTNTTVTTQTTTETTTTGTTTTPGTTTTTVPPTTTPTIDCRATFVTINKGSTFCSNSKFLFTWCALNSTVDAELATQSQKFQTILSALTLPTRLDYLNNSLCLMNGGVVDGTPSEAFFCNEMSVFATACTKEIASQPGGCSAFNPPSCGLVRRSVAVNCREPSRFVVGYHNCTETGWGQVKCGDYDYATPTFCGKGDYNACAFNLIDLQDQVTPFLNIAQNASSVSAWANNTICTPGGGTLNAAASPADLCPELPQQLTCNANCTNSPTNPTTANANTAAAPTDPLALPICCFQCESSYNASCTGGSAAVACAKRGCNNLNCWGLKSAAPSTGTSNINPTPTPTPDDNSKKLSGGAIAGIVIALIVVSGAVAGFLYYRHTQKAAKDTAMREYASFTKE